MILHSAQAKGGGGDGGGDGGDGGAGGDGGDDGGDDGDAGDGGDAGNDGADPDSPSSEAANNESEKSRGPKANQSKNLKNFMNLINASRFRGEIVQSINNKSTIEITYRDGWSEKITKGRYILLDSKKRPVVNRATRKADRARMKAAIKLKNNWVPSPPQH